LPGDPGRQVLGHFATPLAVQQFDAKYGVNHPIYIQYKTWIWALLHGDMGTSYEYQSAVRPFVTTALLNSFKLAFLAFVFCVPLAIFGGVMAALNYNGRTDRSISVVGLALLAMPEFVSCLFLIIVFGIWLNVLPIGATVSSGASPFTQGYHLIIPAVAIAFVLFGYIMRMARAGTVEALNADYTRTAVLKGLPRRTVIRRHVLRNALLPTITVVATQVGYLLGGLIAVEVLTQYNGIGTLIRNAAEHNDYPMLEASVLVIGIVYLVVTLIADIAYTLLNPRLRLGGEG
jgi:peptide/nickel transport system permease protein